MLMRFMIILLCLLSLAGCQSLAVKAYHRGNTAYRLGNYQLSFAEYLFAAEGDVAPAQYAVGYQYFNGQGIHIDQIKAIRWFQKAAPYSPRARYALALIKAKVQQPWISDLQKRTEQ